MAGTGSFYTKDMHKALGSELAKNFIARFGVWEFIRMMPRGLRIQRGISKLEDGQLYVANLGVKAGMQSKGIGSQLIEAAARQASTHGLAQLVLDVSEQNPRAEALYQRLGFNVTRVNPAKNKPTGVQLPGSKSMVRKIG